MPETLATYAIVVGGMALAGFIQGISGFAFAMIALSVWAWALSPTTAAELSVLGSLTGQIVSLIQVRGGYDFRRILPLIAGGLVGAPFGVFLLHNADPQRFRLAVGLMLTLYGSYGLLARGEPRVKFGGAGLDAFVGGVGGLLGGLGGMSGAVPAAWTQLRGWKRDLRRATMQAYNIAMHVITLTLYSSAGALDFHVLKLFAILLPVLLATSVLGARLYRRFSERAFARLILILLLLSGLAMLYGSARALWR